MPAMWLAASSTSRPHTPAATAPKSTYESGRDRIRADAAEHASQASGPMMKP